LRKHILESCNLHTILDMPAGTFTGAGVKTVVLFFTKGEPTRKIWYYSLNAGRNMGKTNPLNDKDMEDFKTLQKDKKDSLNSWSLNISDIDETTYDLSVKNPFTPQEAELRTPKKILEDMVNLDKETNEILASIKELV
jgi:type I restriction enzyme M protein